MLNTRRFMQPTKQTLNFSLYTQSLNPSLLENLGLTRKAGLCNTKIIEAAGAVFKKVEARCPGIRQDILEAMQTHKTSFIGAKSCLDHLTKEDLHILQEAYKFLKIYDPSVCTKQ